MVRATREPRASRRPKAGAGLFAYAITGRVHSFLVRRRAPPGAAQATASVGRAARSNLRTKPPSGTPLRQTSSSLNPEDECVSHHRHDQELIFPRVNLFGPAG